MLLLCLMRGYKHIYRHNPGHTRQLPLDALEVLFGFVATGYKCFQKSFFYCTCDDSMLTADHH